MHDVPIADGPLAALFAVLPSGQAGRFQSVLAGGREALAGAVTWNVSSTAAGGGVAEMLRTLIGYFRAAGIDARWLVLDGDERFFAITKSIHNCIHGLGNPSALGSGARQHYESVLSRNLPELLRRVRPGDIVQLHDPQSAGLVPPLRRAGARVVWRSHIGRDTPTDESVAGWEFLRPYVAEADALVFSRHEYVPAWIERDRLFVIPPSIDPLSAKNRFITEEAGEQILSRAGLLGQRGGDGPTRVQGAPVPGPRARLVVQVSRWDRLKDMRGVMTGFARVRPDADVHLMLVGPMVDGVSDDPEEAEVLSECLRAWRELPNAARSRVSLVSVSMEDVTENATIVNAVQRQAAVVVQKSLAEGFGLTVAEAMWKAKPIVASAVGGIRDQITHEQDGLLIGDPADLDAFALALQRLLGDPPFADRLGQAAHHRALAYYLDDRHVTQSIDLFRSLNDGRLP